MDLEKQSPPDSSSSSSSPLSSSPGNPTAPEYLIGFAETSRYIGSTPDLAFFRRFDILAARNLLHYQAQLTELERRLEALDEEDRRLVEGDGREGENGSSGRETKAWMAEGAARSWGGFQFYSREGDGGDERVRKKMEVVMEIRKVLKEYQKALVLHGEVLKLPAPDRSVLSIAKEWLESKKPLLQTAGGVWNRDDDISSLKEPVDRDRLSRGIQAVFGYFYRERRSVPKSWGDIYFYPEEKMSKLIAVISVLLATALLFGAIACLDFISPDQGHGVTVAIIGSFTAAFAVTVGLLTHARRAELFTAVAGYSAVLVVFATVNSNGAVT